MRSSSIDDFVKSPSVLLGAGLRFNPAPLDNDPDLGIHGSAHDIRRGKPL
jgi:hypothetical protein